jgi:putative hydrolase of the HAD superfamily
MPAADLSTVVNGKRAVIFDLFHTLTALESTSEAGRPATHALLGISKDAWDRQLHERSRERLIGEEKDPFAIVAGMAHAIDHGISDDLIRRATENRIAGFALALEQIPTDTTQVLQTLRRSGKRIGLISNADVMEVAAWRQCPVSDQFDATVFSCDFGCVKPEAAIYLHCLGKLGVSASEAVFVGDGGSDELKGAKAVGMTTVIMTGIIRLIWPDRIPERKRYADFVIETLTELVATGVLPSNMSPP